MRLNSVVWLPVDGCVVYSDVASVENIVLDDSVEASVVSAVVAASVVVSAAATMQLQQK